VYLEALGRHAQVEVGVGDGADGLGQDASAPAILVEEGPQPRVDQAPGGVVGPQGEVVERGQPRQRLDAPVGADPGQGDVRLLVGARRPSGPRRSCVRARHRGLQLLTNALKAGSARA
jgi:hypothetical protein